MQTGPDPFAGMDLAMQQAVASTGSAFEHVAIVLLFLVIAVGGVSYVVRRTRRR